MLILGAVAELYGREFIARELGFLSWPMTITFFISFLFVFWDLTLEHVRTRYVRWLAIAGLVVMTVGLAAVVATTAPLGMETR